MGTPEMLGTKSFYVRTHRALAPGHGDTWGARALVLEHREMWGAGILVLGCGDMWGSMTQPPGTGTHDVPRHVEDAEPLAWQDPAMGTQVRC